MLDQAGIVQLAATYNVNLGWPKSNQSADLAMPARE
jgi:hypothetical protein